MCKYPFLRFNPNAERLFGICTTFNVYGIIHDDRSIQSRYALNNLFGVDMDRGSYSAVHYQKNKTLRFAYEEINSSKKSKSHHKHVVPYTPEEMENIAQNCHMIHNGVLIPIYILCPCGSCEHCTMSKQLEYTSRSLIEASYSGTCIFFTLTYSDEHLPSLGLSHEHIPQHMKRFRMALQRNFTDLSVRCLYCGEYSPKMRPHYHGILYFNRTVSYLEFPKLKQLWVNSWPFANPYVTRKPEAFCYCKDHSAASAYICKYITKQALYPEDKLNYRSLVKPFIRGPHQCGLGGLHLDLLRERIINSTDGKIRINVNGKVRNIRIPQFLIDKVFQTTARLINDAQRNIILLNILCNEIFKRANKRTDDNDPEKEHMLSYCQVLTDAWHKHNWYIAETYKEDEVINSLYYKATGTPLSKHGKHFCSRRNIALYYETITFESLEEDLDLCVIADELLDTLKKMPTPEEHHELIRKKFLWRSALDLPCLCYQEKYETIEKLVHDEIKYVNDFMINKNFDLVLEIL